MLRKRIMYLHLLIHVDINYFVHFIMYTGTSLKSRKINFRMQSDVNQSNGAYCFFHMRVFWHVSCIQLKFLIQRLISGILHTSHLLAQLNKAKFFTILIPMYTCTLKLSWHSQKAHCFFGKKYVKSLENKNTQEKQNGM